MLDAAFGIVGSSRTSLHNHRRLLCRTNGAFAVAAQMAALQCPLCYADLYFGKYMERS
jgi:hypothetical protein